MQFFYMKNKEGLGLNRKEVLSYIYVDTQEALNLLIARMRKTERIALDTEGNGLHYYYQKVCLMQLSMGDESYIVDPLAGVELESFLNELVEKPLILHGVDYDLRMMRDSFGFRPRNAIFDTMLAAKLLGYELFGLADLLQRLLDVTLTKKGRKSDWAQRPLTEAQLDYACDDTRYLEPLADRLTRELEGLGRLEWHREMCKRVVLSTENNAVRDPDDAWRIKGTGLLEPRVMNYVRRIWRWREDEAQRADRPPFKIMGNPAILELAIWAASHPSVSLAHGPRLPRHCQGRRLRALERAIRKALETPLSKWPEKRKARPSPNREPDCSRVVEALWDECYRIAETLGIDPAVLAPRAMLASLARKRPRTIEAMMEDCAMMRWQAELLVEGVRRILDNHHG
ncbi:MAG: hypothetical protein C4527_08050 [Candidatus Omnitrophota bacterium]|jgi:ribonuclease D|nr:MAG: hypothetical protein C4527_08050 [Candidatus Omnitrophota bacterium]